jgi:hypothetical protein
MTPWDIDLCISKGTKSPEVSWALGKSSLKTQTVRSLMTKQSGQSEYWKGADEN